MLRECLGEFGRVEAACERRDRGDERGGDRVVRRTLDPDKAISYEAQMRDAQSRKSMRMTEFLSLTCKLVHAAQYRPAGRPYLTCMFTALAGFGVDETVQRLWTERTGFRCWGGFASVMDAACGGHLEWLRPMTPVYISGSPCPDYIREQGSGTASRAAPAAYGSMTATSAFVYDHQSSSERLRRASSIQTAAYPSGQRSTCIATPDTRWAGPFAWPGATGVRRRVDASSWSQFD